jgi:glycosyltransferase involved in cell wall biosynthesis
MPLVSIIVPCYNEAGTIRLLLDSIHRQTFPAQEMEVIIADGLSTDETRRTITGFQKAHPDLLVKLIDNPKRVIPAALNIGIAAARGEFVVRLDAHSMPRPDYVQRCVEALQAGRGDNVGGVWEIKPGAENWPSRAIAAAAAHPLGVGDARYRLGGEEQAVDTVPFGSFRRQLIERIGPFNEALLTNEDYEFNVRIRQAGGRVWFDPAIRSEYFARRDFASLARQYWRYGYWKARMLLRYPEAFRLRQAAGLFVISFPILAVLGLWLPWAWWILLFEGVLYLSALLVSGIQMAIKQRDLALILGVPMAIATMHFAWGSAFLWSVIWSVIGSKFKQ